MNRIEKALVKGAKEPADLLFKQKQDLDKIVSKLKGPAYKNVMKAISLIEESIAEMGGSRDWALVREKKGMSGDKDKFP